LPKPTSRATANARSGQIGIFRFGRGTGAVNPDGRDSHDGAYRHCAACKGLVRISRP
jgi:hypothetical protein